MHSMGENRGFLKWENVKIQLANERFQLNILIHALLSYLFLGAMERGT